MHTYIHRNKCFKHLWCQFKCTYKLPGNHLHRLELPSFSRISIISVFSSLGIQLDNFEFFKNRTSWSTALSSVMKHTGNDTFP